MATIKAAQIKEGNISQFDFTYDARFESMRDYPRKKQLFRSHMDIEKQSEKTHRHLKSNQRVIINDCNRKIQKMEERFTKLIQHTFLQNTKKTSGLVYSYNRWMRRNHSRLSTSFDKIFDGNIQAVAESNEFDRSNCETPIVTCDIAREPKRLPSHRSVSVDNIPTEIQQDRRRRNGQMTMFGIGATCHNQLDEDLILDGQMSSLSLCDVRNLSKHPGTDAVKVV